MMSSKAAKSIKHLPQADQQDLARGSRKTLKEIQPSTNDKENLFSRATRTADGKFGFIRDKGISIAHEAVQTDEKFITEEDLTSDNPRVHYWKNLAEVHKAALDISIEENAKLKECIESCQNERDIALQMLDEANILVDVLNDIIGE